MKYNEGTWIISHTFPVGGGETRTKFYGPYNGAQVDVQRLLEEFEVAYADQVSRFRLKRVEDHKFNAAQQKAVDTYGVAWQKAKANHEWNVANVPAAKHDTFDPYVSEDQDEDDPRRETCAMEIYRRRKHLTVVGT